MRSILKTTLAATFCPIGSAGLLAAQTATTKTVVGMTAAGDQVVKEVTYMILPVPMTEAQIAAVNAAEGQGGGAAPGPYTGWTVLSADNFEVGKVTFSVQDPEGRIEYFNFVMPNTNRMLLTNGIAKMGVQMIGLRITKADVDAHGLAGFNNVAVQ
ncbi:hypothetical protein SAMN05216227_102823 [Pseudorhodobacter antarcticus]|jgi:hypothetical protein|uniref:Uncharacterized protein n=1 Tax=Pseudorhodobacter antarcticus TaxID=1077947 RepID=A0A1H8K033_9RHOB|nr:hypothetical protein [Pseudorhodobacter antarcticus]SEN86155.1 hypothetical protein SAMN05216227_102823 [Pseudorhodobacter antarcticus]